MSSTEQRTVVVEREFSCSPEKIWRALTEPHLIAEWLMKNDFEPAVGHRFNLRADPQPGWNGIVDCEVLAIKPNRTLTYSWTSGEAALALNSVVTLSLTPTDAGTLLRMEQSGFRPDQAQNVQGAKYGWQHFLGRLDEVVARME